MNYRWMISFKVLLTSTAVLSTAMILNHSAPTIADFAVSKLPFIWTFLQSLLKPPYLYILINAIIISIVASSKFHNKAEVPPPTALESPVTTYVQPAVYNGIALEANVYYANTKIADVKMPEQEMYARVEEAENMQSNDQDTKVMNEKDEGVIENIVQITPQRMDSLEKILLKNMEKPPFSSRFTHRKAIKASSEGKALRVSKIKKNDTLESTWKAITEGRSMPLSRHLKKSETFNERQSYIDDQIDGKVPMMNKSETFHERSRPPLSRASGSGKMKRERSMSSEELNKRVEAFIKKFNEDMRLQRQESLNQYLETIDNRAQ